MQYWSWWSCSAGAQEGPLEKASDDGGGAAAACGGGGCWWVWAVSPIFFVAYCSLYLLLRLLLTDHNQALQHHNIF
jgi:hypothetical protein